MSGRLFLDEDARASAWAHALAAIDAQAGEIERWKVQPTLDDRTVRALVASVDFEAPMGVEEAIALVVRGLQGGQVHTSHPRYFGLFNPPASTLGAVADALVAAYNPQLAARTHAPFAVEVEQSLLRAVGARFGFEAAAMEGTFTSGGAEANATALLCALATRFPTWTTEGVRSLPKAPVLFASREAHHSLEKAARAAGLGDRAVKRVATDGRMRTDPRALAEAIAQNKGEGRAPFLVVATCGTTNAGIVDPIDEIADVAEREALWLHVDAAWGGLAAFVPELRPLVRGLPRADSVTFDAHKSLAVPMGAGMYLARRSGGLARAFAVHTQYMPKGDDDPYARSLQWSRRFTGLKLFLTLAVAGWGAYEEALRGQVALGRRLREGLTRDGWVARNDTPLPVVCFVDGRREGGASGRYLSTVARAVAADGWLSTTRLGKDEHALRACIANPTTRAADVDALVSALGEARLTVFI